MAILMDYQKKIFDKYLNSTFLMSNHLNKSEYESNALTYKINYEEFLPKNKNAKILDIGCGSGHFLYFLKKIGYIDFIGIDVSSQQVAYCNKYITKDAKNIDVFDYLKNTNELFEVIIANDFIEHLNKEKIFPFLNLIHNSLIDKGTFIVKTPNMENPFSLYSRYCDFTHEVGFTTKSLYQILATSQFSCINIFPARNHIKSGTKSIIERLIRTILYTVLKGMMQMQGFIAPQISSLNLIATARKAV